MTEEFERIDDPEFDEMDEWEEDDINSQNKFEELLTIAEMQELLQQEPYKIDEDEPYQPELQLDEKSGKYFTDYFKDGFDDHILLRHILAELCVAHKEELDWERVTNGYDVNILAEIVGLYYCPLAWSEIPTSLAERYIIVGKFAKEVVVKLPERMDVVFNLLEDGREKRVLWFVDHMPAHGIANWEAFLSNYCRGDILKALEPNSDHSIPPITDIRTSFIKENLEYVIKYRGIKKAQEVLERLRKEWNHLVKLKICKFDKLTNEEIEELREYVFDTINYQMDLWKINAGEVEEVEEEEERSAGKPDGSFFAVGEKMSFEACEKELIGAINGSKNKAAACREILRLEVCGFFVLSDKTDQEKAAAINPWVAYTNKKYRFTGDDFRKARNG